jgi:hypothetical protein
VEWISIISDIYKTYIELILKIIFILASGLGCGIWRKRIDSAGFKVLHKGNNVVLGTSFISDLLYLQVMFTVHCLP